MPVLEITPTVRRSYGLDSPATVPGRSQTTGRRKTPKAVTEQAIIDLMERTQRPMTRLDIALCLGLKKTPYLVGLIEGLREQGLIIRSSYILPHGVICYEYWPMWR